MTAEPTSHGVWSPDPIRQRLAVYTLEDVLKLPEDAPRVELRDGVMIVVPTPSIGHQQTANFLWSWLREHSPEDFEPATAIGVALSVRDSAEPELVADATEELVLTAPFEIRLPIRDITP
jgi:hypothetical protein